MKSEGLRIWGGTAGMNPAEIGLVLTGATVSLGLLYLSPLLALATALGIGATFYFSRRVDHLLYFLILYLPLEEFLLKWLDYSLYPYLRYGIELIIYLILAGVICGKLARNEKLASSPIDLPLLLLAAAGLVSIFFNHIPVSAGILGLRPLLRYAAIFYLIQNSDLSDRILPTVFKFIMLITAVEIAIGLAQYLIGEEANYFLKPKSVLVGQTIVDFREKWQELYGGQKIFATLGRYNLLGAFLVSALILSLGYRLQKGFLSLKEKLFALSGGLALLLSYSRLSWAGLLAGVATLLLIRKKFKFIVVAALIAGCAVMMLSSGATTLYQSETQGSLKDRLLGPLGGDYWQMNRSSQRLFAASQLLNNISGWDLILGYGPGTIGSLVTNLREGISQVHQIGDPKKLLIIGDVGWLALLGQIGLVGTGLFVWALVALFRASRSIFNNSDSFWLKSFALGLCGYIVAMAVMNVFSLAFEARVSSAYFWILAGCVIKFAPQNSDSTERRRGVTP
ncbi:MAG: hypothetical protein L0Y74_08575 [candidate division Zixibacteria bacterium]|nr:hypothetical protein [candidate division Zixibacteria bacterium]